MDTTTRTALQGIKPGGRVVYYIGDLAHDRCGFSAASDAINEIARQALALYREGRVLLVQRAMGVPGDTRHFEYIAIGRMPRLHEQPGLGPRPMRTGRMA